MLVQTAMPANSQSLNTKLASLPRSSTDCLCMRFYFFLYMYINLLFREMGSRGCLPCPVGTTKINFFFFFFLFVCSFCVCLSSHIIISINAFVVDVHTGSISNTTKSATCMPCAAGQEVFTMQTRFVFLLFLFIDEKRIALYPIQDCIAWRH